MAKGIRGVFSAIKGAATWARNAAAAEEDRTDDQSPNADSGDGELADTTAIPSSVTTPYDQLITEYKKNAENKNLHEDIRKEFEQRAEMLMEARKAWKRAEELFPSYQKEQVYKDIQHLTKEELMRISEWERKAEEFRRSENIDQIMREYYTRKNMTREERKARARMQRQQERAAERKRHRDYARAQRMEEEKRKGKRKK